MYPLALEAGRLGQASGLGDDAVRSNRGTVAAHAFDPLEIQRRAERMASFAKQRSPTGRSPATIVRGVAARMRLFALDSKDRASRLLEQPSHLLDSWSVNPVLGVE